MPKITASDGIDLLTASGIPVEVKSYRDLRVAERAARLFVRQSPPSPSSIESSPEQIMLYVIPKLNDGLRQLATKNRQIALVSISDRTVIWDGKELHIPGLKSANKKNERPGERRVAWGRYALLRALARTSTPRTQQQLAEETDTTQAAVSQNLRKLAGLVRKTSDGWTATDPREIAEQFLADYPGAKGITTRWFSLDPIIKQASKITDAHDNVDILISGDSGADAIAPWRTPTASVVYGRSGQDLADLGFATTDADHATLEYTVPADPTIWTTARAWGLDHVADPLIVAHDIQAAGAPDAEEAVQRILGQMEKRWWNECSQ